MEEEAVDATVSLIHRGFASGGETMAARRRHLKKVEVAAIGTTDPRFVDHFDIVFTNHDVEGLHFLQDDAFIVKLTIARCFVKRILLTLRVRST